MTSEPDRAQVLKMVESGQVSPADAVPLLDSARPARLSEFAHHWLHIRVTDTLTDRQKVNVNVPLTWVALGMRIGARYSAELARLDLNEILDAIRTGADGRLIEVEDEAGGERVEVFVD
jgi:hypothetical protein